MRNLNIGIEEKCLNNRALRSSVPSCYTTYHRNHARITSITGRRGLLTGKIQRVVSLTVRYKRRWGLAIGIDPVS